VVLVLVLVLGRNQPDEGAGGRGAVDGGHGTVVSWEAGSERDRPAAYVDGREDEQLCIAPGI
jgi:hypothetical protein